RAAGELNDFECAAKIYIEALLFGLPIERRCAVNHGICGLNELMIVVVGKAKELVGKVAEKNSGAICDALGKFRKIHVELQRLPEAFTSLLLIFRAHEQIQRFTVTTEQSCG